MLVLPGRFSVLFVVGLTSVVRTKTHPNTLIDRTFGIGRSRILRGKARMGRRGETQGSVGLDRDIIGHSFPRWHD